MLQVKNTLTSNEDIFAEEGRVIFLYNFEIFQLLLDISSDEGKGQILCIRHVFLFNNHSQI